MSAFIPAVIVDRVMAPEVHWKEAYQFVEHSARNLLTSLVPGEKLTTAQFVATLYNGDDELTRQRIFSALKALASHGLADCWSPGPERKTFIGGGKLVRPKLWGAPPAKTCPSCGVKLP